MLSRGPLSGWVADAGHRPRQPASATLDTTKSDRSALTTPPGTLFVTSISPWKSPHHILRWWRDVCSTTELAYISTPRQSKSWAFTVCRLALQSCTCHVQEADSISTNGMLYVCVVLGGGTDMRRIGLRVGCVAAHLPLSLTKASVSTRTSSATYARS